ncbi:hypothetical protein ACVXHA_30080 [Escherichia coli]
MERNVSVRRKTVCRSRCLYRCRSIWVCRCWAGQSPRRVTCSFIAATADNYLRAYNMSNGEKLWQGRLPAGGQATPMTYEVNGKQYVVISAGGHGSFGTKMGDYIVAYALPDDVK